MTTDAQKEAKRKYRKANIRQLNLEFNKKTDADIVKRLDQVENMQGYIKNLIKKDMLLNPDKKSTEPLIKDEKIKKLLGEVVELEVTVNDLNKRFDEFNKHYAELCVEEDAGIEITKKTTLQPNVDELEVIEEL